MQKSKKQKIFEIVIIILFVVLSFLVCQYHEYWADEAHAWLFARDCSIYELLTKYIHSDGHPILWFLVIKFFQLLGLSYDNFNMISVLFSSLGVAIFVTKSKFPIYIKALFPFTYFIFFQYTVIARGYCLIFFILSWLATIYDKRHEKILLYTLVMMLLISTEAYTFLFAGMLYLIYLYEFIKNRKEYDKKIKTKHIISLITLFIFFCLTVLYVYPYPTNTFNPHSLGYYPTTSFFITYQKFLSVRLGRIAFLTTVLLGFVIYLIYKDQRKKLYEMLFLLFPVLIFYTFKYHNAWHLGIMLLLFIFIFWIHNLEKNKYVLALLSITIVVQIYWTCCSVNYEIHNSFSGAKEAAMFIKQYDYSNLKIFGLEFYCSGLNPYFQKNIYDNWNEDKGFFYWDKSSKFYNINEKKFLEHILDTKYDIVVMAPEIKFEEFDDLKEEYNYYDFEGNTYVENYRYENQTYRVFVKKSIDNR